MDLSIGQSYGIGGLPYLQIDEFIWKYDSYIVSSEMILIVGIRFYHFG